MPWPSDSRAFATAPSSCCSPARWAFSTSATRACRGSAGCCDGSSAPPEVEKNRAEVAALADERATLERRVSQLRSDNLDLDLLDQEARRLLNLGHPDEEVLFHDPQPGPDAAE